MRQLLDGFGEWARALVEVVTVVFFGAIPFFALLIRKNLSEPTLLAETRPTFEQLWADAFGSGQLYLYVFAIFGTLVWLALVDWRYKFTKLRIFGATLVFVLGLYLSALANFDPTFTKLTDGWVVTLGYWLFGSTCLLYWALLVFRQEEPDKPSDVFDREAIKMASGMQGLPT